MQTSDPDVILDELNPTPDITTLHQQLRPFNNYLPSPLWSSARQFFATGRQQIGKSYTDHFGTNYRVFPDGSLRIV